MRTVPYKPETIDPTFTDVLPDNQRAVIRALNSLRRLAGDPESNATQIIRAAATLLEVAHLRGNSEHVSNLHHEAYASAHSGAFLDE